MRALLFPEVLPGEGRPDRAALVRFSSVGEATWIVENVGLAELLYGIQLTGNMSPWNYC